MNEEDTKEKQKTTAARKMRTGANIGLSLSDDQILQIQKAFSYFDKVNANPSF